MVVSETRSIEAISESILLQISGTQGIPNSHTCGERHVGRFIGYFFVAEMGMGRRMGGMDEHFTEIGNGQNESIRRTKGEQGPMKRARGTGSVYSRPGSANLWIQYPRNGKLVRESSGTDSKTQAQKLLNQRIGEIATGNYIEPSNRKLTVDELYESYLDDYRANEKASLEGAEQRWQRQPKEGKPMPKPGRLKAYFGGWKALAVTTDKLNQYIVHCKKLGKSNGTINRDISALQRSYTLACEAKKIQEKDIPHFPRLKEAPPRDGFLEPAEYTKLTQHAPELWLRTLLACLALGMRKGELIGDPRFKGGSYQDALRVRHVDFRTRMIRLKVTKNGDDRTVPMSRELYPLMVACVSGKAKNDFVFTRANGEQVLDFRGRWERLLKDAGVEEKLVHDNRRSAARNMREAGIDEGTIMKIGGWKTRSVFERYNIIKESDLSKAVGKYDAARQDWEVQAQFKHSEDDLHQNRASVEIENVDLKPLKSVN